ncbi:MAG: carotenoid biosynthesis protein, partial [Promethearchaeota archaeon]
MYKELFIYPALIAYVLLIIHSFLFRGSKKTITFFGLAFIFGFIREFYYKYFVGAYTFVELTTFTLLGVPIAIPIGWTFTFYIGLFFAQKILNFNIDLDNVPERLAKEVYASKLLPLILIASIFSTTVSFAIETCAINMGWWEFTHIASYYAPLSVLFGWFGTSLLFFHLYIYIQYKSFRL